MRRFFFILTLLGFTALANSAFAQDTTAKRDSARRDSIYHRLVHQDTSRGEVDKKLRKPPQDTSKIRAPSKRDSSLVRQELRADTTSVARGDTVRDRRPPPDTQAKKPPPPAPPPRA